MQQTRKTGQRLIAVFVGGVILLNYPILFLFTRPVRIGEVPLLYAYVFGAWTVLIGVMAYAIERSRE